MNTIKELKKKIFAILALIWILMFILLSFQTNSFDVIYPGIFGCLLLLTVDIFVNLEGM